MAAVSAEVLEGKGVVKMSSGIFLVHGRTVTARRAARLPSEDMKKSSTCPAKPFHRLLRAAIFRAQTTRGVLTRAACTQAHG